MPSNRRFIKHLFAGGWATDFGPNFEGASDRSNYLEIPFLVNAENVFYELDGAPHKVGGTEKLNDTVLEGGSDITGLFDFWITGTTGVPTQHRVVTVGTTIKADNADGVFANIFTGKSSTAIPDFEVFDDLLIISNDAVADVPMSWDGTTAQNLAGTPPNFAFSTIHSSHLFAAGVDSAASTLFFSAPFDPEDWAGAGSGNIKFDPDDGDRITAIISHKNKLFIFKGPHKGSIHVLTGTSSSDFAVEPFIQNLGAVSQRLTIPFRDDVLFMWTDGSIRSLSATEEFGDFRETSLSVAINREFLGTDITFASLKAGQAVNDTSAGVVLFALPINGSASNNTVLMMDYRFMEGTRGARWALWTDFDDTGALAYVNDPDVNDKQTIMAGHADGFVRKWNRSTRSFDGLTGINARITTPFLNYGLAHVLKTLSGASLSIASKNDGDIVLGWTRDTNTQQSTLVGQGGNNELLAPSATNQFTLGTSKLAGSLFQERFTALDEEGGEFRAIQYETTNGAVNEDMEIHGFGAFISRGAESTENN